MKVIVFVGLPGAGKSTKAKEFESQGYVIHSVDSIRNEFNLHEQNDISKVLNIFNERLIIDLNAKKNIVYDSTNLSVMLHSAKDRVPSWVRCVNRLSYRNVGYVS